MARSGETEGLPSWARRHLDEPADVVPSAPAPTGGPRRGGHRARRTRPDRMRGWGLAAVAIAAAAGVVPMAVTTLTDDRDDVRLPVVDAFPAVAPAPLDAPYTGMVPALPGLTPAAVVPATVPPDGEAGAVPAPGVSGPGAPPRTTPSVSPTPVAGPTAASTGVAPPASGTVAPAPGRTVLVVPPPQQPTPRSGTRPTAPPSQAPSDPPEDEEVQQTQQTQEAPVVPVQRRVAPDTRRAGDAGSDSDSGSGDGLLPGVFGVLDQLSGPLLPSPRG